MCPNPQWHCLNAPGITEQGPGWLALIPGCEKQMLITDIPGEVLLWDTGNEMPDPALQDGRTAEKTFLQGLVSGARTGTGISRDPGSIIP